MIRWNPVLVIMLLLSATICTAQADAKKTPRKKAASKPKMQTAHVEKTGPVSFAKDVKPIFGKYCLPCHTEDKMNPSELYLDNYDDMMKGGKHGAPVVAGNPETSNMIQKINPNPPFGDPMPLKRKTPFPKDTLEILKAWIKQGAKNN